MDGEIMALMGNPKFFKSVQAPAPVFRELGNPGRDVELRTFEYQLREVSHVFTCRVTGRQSRWNWRVFFWGMTSEHQACESAMANGLAPESIQSI